MVDMAHCRELLAVPDPGNFRELLALLAECNSLEAKTVAIQYMERHLAEWPDEYREATAFDVVPHTGCCAVPDMSHLSLVRKLDLRADVHAQEAEVDINHPNAVEWYMTPHLSGVKILDLRGLPCSYTVIGRICEDAAFDLAVLHL